MCIWLGFSRNARRFAPLKKLINSLPDYFPSLAEEVAEPCPDTNIKVAAFTVSNQSDIRVFEHCIDPNSNK